MKKIQIWKLIDISIDDIVEKHIEIITNPTVELQNYNELINMGGFGHQEEEITEVEPIYKIVKEAKGMPKKTILYHKYLFLVHQIIYHSRKNEKGYVYINTHLYREIIGASIFQMLYVLKELHIIYLSASYKIGECSRTIELLDWNITCDYTINKTVIDYYNKFIKLCIIERKKQCDKNLENIFNVSSEDDCIRFITAYNDSLLQTKLLNDKTVYKSLLSKDDYSSEQSKHFYLSKIEDWKNDISQGITSIDKNGRIYHYFTNIPSSLKCCFNFKFSIDISNSHPLLLSKLLTKYYNIDNIIPNLLYNTISSIITTNHINHYGCLNLHKALKDFGLERDKFIDIPNDVLYYIMLVETGQFWEKMMSVIKGKSRREVKQTLFGEVFYGKRLNARGYKYAPIFVKMFPNVWHVLRNLKKQDRTQLPNQLMKEESRLFTTILTECFKRGWAVISIHDCIIVLDVEKNAEVQISDVQGIIENVYHEEGLYPTVKVEKYDNRLLSLGF